MLQATNRLLSEAALRLRAPTLHTKLDNDSASTETTSISSVEYPYPGLDAFPNVTLFDLGGGLNIGPDSNAPQFAIQNFS